MTYLVTGGAGFIGANFVKYILKKHSDCKVIILDKLTYAGNLGTIKEDLEDSRVSFYKGDICNKELIENIFMAHNIDIVVNFAAESHVDRSIEDPGIFLTTNILGTQTLMDVAKANWTTGKDSSGYPTFLEGKKFLQVSTDEVYGHLDRDLPDGVVLEFDRARIPGRILQDIVVAGGLLQFMDIVIDIPPGDILIEEIRTDKTGPFLGPGDPFYQVECRKVEPAVVIRPLIGVLPDHKDHFIDISRALEIDIGLLVAGVGVIPGISRIGIIFPQDGEFPVPFPPLAVGNHHRDPGAAVLPLVIRRPVGPADDLIDTQRFSRRIFGYAVRNAGDQNQTACCRR